MTQAHLRPPLVEAALVGERLPLNRLLANSATELLRLVQMVRDIEAAVFDATGPADAAFSPAGKLHYIDVVVQTLTELSEVFVRLAAVTPEDVMTDRIGIVDPVRLGLLRHALAQAIDSPAPGASVRCDKIELF